MPTESSAPLGRSAKLQTSLAYNPTFVAAIMFYKRAFLIANCLGLGLLMGLTACQPAGSMPSTSMNNSSSASSANPNTPSAAGKNDKSAQTELYRLNPAPKEGYEITLTVQDSPGPFKAMSWSAMYQAKGCSYVVDSGAGVRAEPEKLLDLPFERREDGSVVATVFLDAMLNEDYYGNGVCQWMLTGVGTDSTPSGDANELEFGGYIDSDAIRAEGSQSAFYLKELYGGMAPKPASKYETISHAAWSRQNKDQFPVEMQEKIFSFVMASKKVLP